MKEVQYFSVARTRNISMIQTGIASLELGLRGLLAREV